MAKKGNGDCDCGEFDWVDRLPLDQLELLEWLIKGGLKTEIRIHAGTERWEKGLDLLDAITCHKQKLSETNGER
jgi:hypothetical protein